MLDSHCIVCADPLEWTAYGPCGHKETCARCVSRLRSVLKDERCPYCQQQQPCVFVTRFAGDYTQNIPAEAFDTLKDKVDAGDLYYLPSAQAYFDDPQHYEEIKNLCSFTHPKAKVGGKVKVFNSLRALKTHLMSNDRLSFCDICLEGRKVFVSEQQLYTKQSLDRHNRRGDDEGPLADSSFVGHPECRFCVKRFYGENELYQHMHQGHEECFLCKKHRPDKHVYYRDYAELEDHFDQIHYPCKHPTCVEEKFVVFNSEQELKRHTAMEHGASMSRSEKKDALTIPIHFTYARGGASSSRNQPSSSSHRGGPVVHDPAALAAANRSGYTIGGGANAPAGRYSRNNNNNSRSNLAALEQQQAAALAAAAQQQQQPEAPGPLNDVEFPSVTAGQGYNPAIGGRWAGGSGSSAAHLGDGEAFPALPGTSKSARRRTAAKNRASAADVVGRSGRGGVRVLNVAPGAATDANFPSLNGGGGNNNTGGGVGLQPDFEQELRMLERSRDDEWVQASSSSTSRGGGGNRGQRPPSSQEVVVPATATSASLSQFPTLASTSTTGGSPRPASAASSGGGISRKGIAHLPAMPPPSSSTSSKATAAASNAAKVSEGLRAANKALVEKIKSRFGPTNTHLFEQFKTVSGDWIRGKISSNQYHTTIVGLGLASLVPDLAATCPDDSKRLELLDIHTRAFDDSPDPEQVAGSWMPPEAAAAAADYANRHSSWTCGLCTLANAPGAVTCEVCGHPNGSILNQLLAPGIESARGGGGISGGGGQRTESAGAAGRPAMPVPRPNSTNSSSTGTSASNGGSNNASRNPPPLQQQQRAPPPSFAAVSAVQQQQQPVTQFAGSATTVPVTSIPALEDEFPALAVSDSRSGGISGAGGSSSAGATQKGGGGKKGGKNKSKQSLNDFYKNTKVHTQNVWKNTNLRGDWNRAGDRIQEDRAMNDAWN